LEKLVHFLAALTFQSILVIERVCLPAKHYVVHLLFLIVMGKSHEEKDNTKAQDFSSPSLHGCQDIP